MLQEVIGERKTNRQRDRETERQRDRETERQRDRETERQSNGEAKLFNFSSHLGLKVRFRLG
jgi:hypothetical protein